MVLGEVFIDLQLCEPVDELVLVDHEHHPPSLLPESAHHSEHRYLHLLAGQGVLRLLVVGQGHPDVEQGDESASPAHPSRAMHYYLLVLLGGCHSQVQQVVQFLEVGLFRGLVVVPILPLRETIFTWYWVIYLLLWELGDVSLNFLTTKPSVTSFSSTVYTV